MTIFAVIIVINNIICLYLIINYLFIKISCSILLTKEEECPMSLCNNRHVSQEQHGISRDFILSLNISNDFMSLFRLVNIPNLCTLYPIRIIPVSLSVYFRDV